MSISVIVADVEPPAFANCPSAVREVAYLSSAFFAEPTATDNVMVSDLTVTPNDYRVSDIVQHDLQVSYIARDHAANLGSCVVNIRVRGQGSLLVLSPMFFLSCLLRSAFCQCLADFFFFYLYLYT